MVSIASVRRARASRISLRLVSSISTAVARKTPSDSAMRPISSVPPCGRGDRRSPAARRNGAIAEPLQPRNEIAADIEPDDQGRAHQAHQHGNDQARC